MKKALLIIDVQNAMIAVESPVYKASEKIKSIQSIIHKARAKNIPIIYVQHNEHGSEFENGTDTWQIFAGIKPQVNDTVIQKTESDSFYETPLKDVLEHNQIDQLVIVGMQTEYCVNATSTRAVELGFDVTLIKDAHSTWNSDEQSAIEIINMHNNKWINSMSLINENEYEF